jgi:16S rRNA (guanine527-N7)-methyltransferase
LTGPKLESIQVLVPDVSRETFQRLIQFEDMFRSWSARINLAAPSTLPDLWTRHILDSAQLATFRPLVGNWLDLGSGGGLPGVILAILAGQRREAHIHLVESRAKKAAFLQSVLGKTQSPGTVHLKRIEDVPGAIQCVDVVTARALAPLKELIRLALPWLSKGATGLFHKGREFQQEVELARDVWRFDLIEHRSVIDENSVILEISNVSQRLRGELTK